jgi:hypothetical protein
MEHPTRHKDKISQYKMDYTKKTIIELRKIAKQSGLQGYSGLRKAELIAKIEAHNAPPISPDVSLQIEIPTQAPIPTSSVQKVFDKTKLAINTCVKVISKLGELFEKCRTVSLSNHTHVLLAPPFGKIDVSSDMIQFWNVYQKCAASDVPLHVAETPGLESPIRVDVDLRARKDVVGDNPLYTIDEVRRIIAAYQLALCDSLVDLPKEALTCLLLEKQARNMNVDGVMYVKHGFHLHFPKIFTDNLIQQAYIIPYVKSKTTGLFNHLRAPDVTVDLDFIDTNVCKVHWLQYKSAKKDSQPYEVTRCFDHECREVSVQNALKDYKISRFGEKDVAVVGTGSVIYNLPRILSTVLYDRVCYYYKPQPHVSAPIIEKCTTIETDRPNFNSENITALTQESETLLTLMSDNRADDRNDWLAIGFTLWNITEGDDAGLNMWLDFSARSHKYNEVECLNIWARMRKGNYNIGTLKYFAKQDNKEEYDEFYGIRNKSRVVGLAKPPLWVVAQCQQFIAIDP